jgi:hypothetical protein
VTAALAQAMGDQKLLAELAGVFLAEGPRWMTEMCAAIADGDPSRLHLAAHALKGAATTFAAPGTYEAALTWRRWDGPATCPPPHRPWRPWPRNSSVCGRR